MSTTTIRIGTSGFSYEDWVGPFYPKNLSKSKWFDYYAQEFSCLEINASYYSWMTPRAMQSLASRAPHDFNFAVKLNKSITHGKEDIQKGILATLEQNAPLDNPVHLAQFPNGFKPSEENWSRVEGLSTLPKLVVEFRNSEWQTDETYKRLTKLGISLCAVDSPRIEGLPRFTRNLTGPIAYTRFHGRNAEKWYEHDHAYERYDYLYTESELTEIADDLKSMAVKMQDAFVFFNNHYAAQSVTNARQLATHLGVATTPAQEKLFE
ncbi:MAG: DUF72 domain-containing protein [Fimbriimonadales bacterium]